MNSERLSSGDSGPSPDSERSRLRDSERPSSAPLSGSRPQNSSRAGRASINRLLHWELWAKKRCRKAVESGAAGTKSRARCRMPRYRTSYLSSLYPPGMTLPCAGYRGHGARWDGGRLSRLRSGGGSSRRCSLTAYPSSMSRAGGPSRARHMGRRHDRGAGHHGRAGRRRLGLAGRRSFMPGAGWAGRHLAGSRTGRRWLGTLSDSDGGGHGVGLSDSDGSPGRVLGM